MLSLRPASVLPEIIICFIRLTIIHGNPDLDTVNRAPEGSLASGSVKIDLISLIGTQGGGLNRSVGSRELHINPFHVYLSKTPLEDDRDFAKVVLFSDIDQDTIIIR